jgi:GrpB-like predicted nucleotidyltransferase (UPF0157 family)
MKIHLEKYNPNWSLQFQAEKKQLEIVLAEIQCEIEHIGSTAVVGMAAKPFIDIMIGLQDIQEAAVLVDALVAQGYHYVPAYESSMPERRFFFKDAKTGMAHNIHAVALGSAFWKRHLAFRDYLRQYPIVAAEYQALKMQLAEREWQDGNEYAQAKNEFIRRIEEKAKQEF